MGLEKILSLFKKPYLESALTRPDWTKNDSRDENLLWLDKNENIDPILLEKLKAILHSLKPSVINTYPEAAKVYKKLAVQNKLQPENFILTNGSDGSIRMVFDVFVNQGDKVLYTNPTFAMYSVYSKMFGANVIAFDYDRGPSGPVLNYDQLVSVIKTEKPKVVCLPNPDSPTGTILEPSKLRELIQITNDLGIVLLIDEAYYLFYNETVLSLVNQFPNLLVCRTFSKAWGAAGARVGFLAGYPEIISIIHKNRPMYEVGALSTEFINLLLDHEPDVLASVKRLQEGKEYFIKEIRQLGFTTTISHGNFLHVDFKDKKDRIDAALKEVVLYRENFPGVKGLEGYARFSLGTIKQFQLIIQKIRSVL